MGVQMRGVVLPLCLSLVIAGVAGLGTAGTARAATVQHTWRSDVDGDGHIEQVQLVHRGALAWWLRLIDRVHGRRVVVRLSPPVQFMSPSGVAIADLNNLPHRKEIYYWGTNGTAGGDSFAGIVNWDGGWLHSFGRYHPPYPARVHHGIRLGTAGGEVRLAQLASAKEPSPELVVNEGEYAGGEPLCCPPWSFIRYLRYNAPRRRWAVYAQRWVKG